MIVTQHVWVPYARDAATLDEAQPAAIPALDEAIAAARPNFLVARLVSVVPAGSALPPETYLLTWEVSG
jgi:hypothetical protein